MASRLREKIPNWLTVSRLLIAAAFFATISLSIARGEGSEASRQLWGNIAVALFLIAAFTDALDGHLARKWGVVSDFGRIMDPFCDKVLVLGTFAYLASPRFALIDAAGNVASMTTGIWSWMLVVLIARELLVTAIRGLVESRGIAFGADWWGKSKMMLQSFTAPFCLFVAVNPPALANETLTSLQLVLVYATVAVTAVSALPYILRARRALATSGDGKIT